MTHDFPTYDGQLVLGVLVVRVVLQLFTKEPVNITPELVRSRIPHVTGIVVLYEFDAAHEAVLDDDQEPDAEVPQLIWYSRLASDPV